MVALGMALFLLVVGKDSSCDGRSSADGLPDLPHRCCESLERERSHREETSSSIFHAFST